MLRRRVRMGIVRMRCIVRMFRLVRILCILVVVTRGLALLLSVVGLYPDVESFSVYLEISSEVESSGCYGVFAP